MRRWGLEVVTFVVVIAVGFLVLLATGVDVDELFDFDEETKETPLSPLPGAPQETEDTTTTTALPVEVIVTTATTSVLGDPEAVMLCIQHTKTYAFLGDQEAMNLWLYVGQDEEVLAEACAQLAREDSRAVDVWRWELAALPQPTGTTALGSSSPPTLAPPLVSPVQTAPTTSATLGP
jgi:hypothetical protein